MTGADVVGIAKQVAFELDVQASDIEPDENQAQMLVQAFQENLKEAILPGMTDDEKLPSLPIKGLRSSVNADLLKLFPSSLTQESLQ